MPQSNGRPASDDGLVSNVAAHEADRRSPTAAVRRRLVLASHFSQIGGRLAMVAAAPLFGVAAVGLVLQQDPVASVRQLAVSVFGPSPAPLAGIALALAGGAMAGWAAPRVVTGRDGWLRHLPVSAFDLHVGTICALCATQAPVAVVFVGLALVAGAATRSLNLVSALWVPTLVVAMAMLMAPSRRRWLTTALAAGAIAGAFTGSWLRLGIGLGLVLLSAACSAPIARVRAQPRRRLLSWVPVPERITLRALGRRSLVAYAWAIPIMAAVELFRVNNRLDAATAAPAARLGAGLAVTIVLAAIAERLAVNRPCWPWLRSLPWATRARVLSDVRFFLVSALPVLGIVAALSGRVLLAVCGVTWLIAAVAAAAVRRAPERRTGAAGEVLAVGALASASVALVPWLAVACVAVVAFVVRVAIVREQRQRVSRWLERHHHAAGDSLSWSGG